MAIQFLPILKAVAPYVAQIATAAIPAFTSKPGAHVDPLVARQIEELQAAATQNAEGMHVLAESLQEAIGGMEAAAGEARKQLAFYKAMLILSLALSLLSFSACLYLLLGS